MNSRQTEAKTTFRLFVLFPAAALTLVTACCTAAPGDKPGSANLKLWYRLPAQQWTEALPVGNGRLGAMVFADAKQERLQLNEDTLYAGEPGRLGVVPIQQI